MKLLLTSAGLTNQAILDAMIRLTLREPEDLNVAYIPTAANPDKADIERRIERFHAQTKFDFNQFDVLDIAAMEKDRWLPRLQRADVIYVGGGNTYYLLDQVRQSGLADELPRLLESRVYVGESAGSILVTPSINVAAIDNGDENTVGLTDTVGLSLVDFEVSPHTSAGVSVEVNEVYAKTITNHLYCYDDSAALRIDGQIVDYVGPGHHWEYN